MNEWGTGVQVVQLYRYSSYTCPPRAQAPHLVDHFSFLIHARCRSFVDSTGTQRIMLPLMVVLIHV